MLFLFLTCVDYASDEEWSRYLMINVICWLALVGFLITDYYFFSQNLQFYTTDKLNIFSLSGTDVCNQLFQVNLWCNLIVAIIISILAILQILQILLTAKRFFLTAYVEHTAVCNDDDIIVF